MIIKLLVTLERRVGDKQASNLVLRISVSSNSDLYLRIVT